MQRNKYLDDLGIPIKEYGTNFVSEDDKSNHVEEGYPWDEWEKQREEYGFDSRECWNLDRTFVEWMYSHLMRYKEDAAGIIDLNFEKHPIFGEEYTEEEAIDYILERLRNYLTADIHSIYDNKTYEDVRDAIRMLAEVLFGLWW